MTQGCPSGNLSHFTVSSKWARGREDWSSSGGTAHSWRPLLTAGPLQLSSIHGAHMWGAVTFWGAAYHTC